MSDNLVKAQIYPGRSLGWITLGSSLHSVITRIKSDPQSHSLLDLSYSSSDPTKQPIVLNLPSNGLRLRFDGPDQRLRLIEVLDFSRSILTYKNTELIRRSRPSGEDQEKDILPQGPTFRHVYNRLFGPAYPGEYVSPEGDHSDGTYILSYPGLAFSFPVKHKSWSDKADFVTLLSSNATSPAASMAIFSGPSWPEVRSSLYSKIPSLPRSSNLTTKGAESVPDEIDLVKIYGGGKVELLKRNTPTAKLILSETTEQDLIAELGPPDAIYYKNDDRISIHTTKNSSGRQRPSISPAAENRSVDTDHSSGQSYAEDSDTDVPSLSNEQASPMIVERFYNYFHHGFDALIAQSAGTSPPFPGEDGFQNDKVSSSQLVVTKIILHANVPGSYSFNRHRRSRWVIIPDSLVTSQPITSEMPFSELSPRLREIWHGTYTDEDEEKRMQRGMVLNRGWGNSPDSSIELLGRFQPSSKEAKDKSEVDMDNSPSLNNTELFGFPGLLFEVLKNDAVSCLTVY